MIRPVAVLSLLLVVGCAGDPDASPSREVTSPSATASPSVEPAPTPTPEAVPGETWDRDERGRFGDLDAMLDGAGSSCGVVVSDGVIVHERYTAGAAESTTRPAYSITKSVTALLVAMAIDDGDLTLDTRVAEHVPGWRDTASSQVTVRELMANTSGRAWTWDLDYGQMVREASDKTAFAVGLDQQHPPGEHWEYNNSAVQVLEAVLRSATGREVRDFAAERLFEPLGLQDTSWETDGVGSTTTYSGLASSCRDLARVGLLVARQGQWGDERLVRTETIDELVSPSSRLNAGYGLLWWVNGEGRVQTIDRATGFAADSEPFRGRLGPKVPDDATWAIGFGNQVLAVVPSRDVVAVRMGPLPATPDAFTLDGFTTTVLAGLR
ncbi:serine hydrolase domain-containing protein [Aeromicrobium sp. CF4.19]|uniref:serine hydrolase domain-containing protein n=1 Tax=Aeromicrobium sp. CF4.19 TaxID=3373082 RepID=UPI003EE698EC